jgi:vacuolar-type H+-ATPase subunit E/Vma4
MTWVIDNAALAPLRAALVANARADADRVVTAARVRADQHVAAALTAAAARVAEARARAEADTASALAGEAARVRQQGRALLLAARRAVYDELRRRTHEAVRSLRDEPAYAGLRSAVENTGIARLGSGAISRESRDGGCIVEAPGMRIEATLDALADWALETVSTEFSGRMP